MTLDYGNDAESLPRLSQMDFDNKLNRAKHANNQIDDDISLEQRRRNAKTASNMCRNPQIFTRYFNG